jgi:heme-degrading monooxygenase HmoA
VSRIADTPEPPYVAVIFTSRRTPAEDGYGETAGRMEALAREQPGFLGIESVRAIAGAGESTLGITVSYWATDEAARAWKRVAEHREAQRAGRDRFYEAYSVRVANVTRAYGRGDSS